MSSLLHFKVLLPSRVFLDERQVRRVVLSTDQGSLGIYPRRRDFVAALVPGILTYESSEGKEVYLAVDRGLVLKAGFEITVSTRNATRGEGLGHLKEAVERDFLEHREMDDNTRATLRKLETDMFRRILEFHK